MSDQMNTPRLGREPDPESRADRADVTLTRLPGDALEAADPLASICDRGGQTGRLGGARLTLALPVFDAHSQIELQTFARELRLEQLFGDPAALASIELPAHLRLSPRGSFNTDRSLSSPSEVYPLGYTLAPARVELDQPVAVSIHDARSGAIFYVAIVVQPSEPPQGVSP
jgi:hypothetical protein